MDNFSQSRYLNTKSIRFQDDGLLYASGNILTSKEIFIPYEEIIYEKTTRLLKTDKFNFWVCVVSLATVVKSIVGIIDNPHGIYKGLLPFSSIFFIAFLVATILSRRRLLYIDTFNSGIIELYDKNASESENFIMHLKTRTQQFLKSKYGKIDKDLPIETQLESLNWLKGRKIITDQEFDNLKIELIGTKQEFKGYK